EHPHHSLLQLLALANGENVSGGGATQFKQASPPRRSRRRGARGWAQESRRTRVFYSGGWGPRAGGFAVQHARPRVGAGVTGGGVHRPGHGKHHQLPQQKDGRDHLRRSRAQGQAHARPLPARSRLGSGSRPSG
ncbi:unnamed protein product, partial [Ectocarpus sp. 8 AP-2014]